jgi:hypothetical protein
VWRKSRSKSPEKLPQSRGVGASSCENAMKNCARFIKEIAATSAYVDLLFISLLSISPFDRTQGLICEEKVGQSLLTIHLDPEAWVLPAVKTR